MLDCSVGNSKSQLHKAKLRIRELLGYARTEAQEPAEGAHQRTSRSSRRSNPRTAMFDDWGFGEDSGEPAAFVPTIDATDPALVQTSVA